VDKGLAGGVANAGQVVRRGEFVLRPSNPYSETIHAYLKTLRGAGFQGASLPVDTREDGRERLIYVEGDGAVPPFPDWAQSDNALASITRLIRSFHETSRKVGIPPGPWSEEMADPDGGPIICHNDVCLENVVFRDGQAVGLLDFDFAAPGRPIYDLAAFARMCIPIDDPFDAERLGWTVNDRPRRLRLVADIYALSDSGRQELLIHLDRSMQNGGSFVKRRADAGDVNFIRMLNEMGGMERYDRRRRWWETNRRAFADGVT